MVALIEVEPGRWRVSRETVPVARSSLPCPMVISDTMPPTEQVDGRFYESKRQYRAIGRAHGLVEVGTEKVGPKVRSTAAHQVKEARRNALRSAVEKFKAGHRPR